MLTHEQQVAVSLLRADSWQETGHSGGETWAAADLT